MSDRFSKILFAAGGTAGHLFPAQALAHELLEKKKGIEILFAGAGLKTNRYFLKERFPFQEVKSSTLVFSRRLGFKSFFLLFKGIRESFKIFQQFSPDLVVGFGSFHAFPLLIVALLKRIPIVLFESNSQPGKVNRFFSRWAHLSAVQFPEAARHLKGPTVEVKMPFWKKGDQKNVTAEEARSYFGLSPDELTLLVFGGSQGSAAINAVFCTAAGKLLEKQRPFQVIHLCGKDESCQEVRLSYAKSGIKACVKAFEDQMSLAWRSASLVICRAGAATLAEQMIFEVPSILIPYPLAAEDHQKKNALFMEKEVKGGICLLEEECTVEKLLNVVETILFSSTCVVEQMRENIRSFKQKQDQKDLYSVICSFLKE